MDNHSIKYINCLNSISKYNLKQSSSFLCEYFSNKENYSVLKNINSFNLHTKDFFEENLYNKLLTFTPSENDTLTINAFDEDYLSFKSREIIKNNAALFIHSIIFIAKDFNFKNIEILIKHSHKNEAELLKKEIEEAEKNSLTYSVNIKINQAEKLPYSKINSTKYLLNIENTIDIFLLSIAKNNNEIDNKNNNENNYKDNKENEINYLVSVSGAVNNASVFQISLNTPLERIIYFAGGVKNEENIKCIFVGGFFSAPIDKNNIKNINIKENKLKLYSGVFFVVNEEVCMIRVVLKIIDFAISVSCKKCLPCRSGFIYLKHITENILSGLAFYDNTNNDYTNFLETALMIKEGSICPQIKSIAKCIYSTTEMFKKEFIHAIENKRTIYSFYKEDFN